MSRNSDRLSAAPQQSIGAQSGPEAANSSVVQYIRQTILVDLPSEGKLYPPEHPYYMQTSVELKEMTAKEEDILMSRSLIQKGIVLDRLLENLLVVPVDTNSLLIGDKNALLFATRIAAYGADYRVQDVTCQYCLQSTKEHSFDLNGCTPITLSDIQEQLPDNVTIENGLFNITVPRTKRVFACKLMTGDDESRVAKVLEARKKNSLNEMTLIEHMRAFIVMIDGNGDRAFINQFLISDQFPSVDSQALRSTYAKLVPNINMKQNFVCSSCGFEKEVVIPMTPSFFWPQ